MIDGICHLENKNASKHSADCLLAQVARGGLAPPGEASYAVAPNPIRPARRSGRALERRKAEDRRPFRRTLRRVVAVSLSIFGPSLPVPGGRRRYRPGSFPASLQAPP